MPVQGLFCLCKLNFNKNQRQACIRREQSELSSKIECGAGKVFKLSEQPIILEKMTPKSKIDWMIFKQFEEDLQAKIWGREKAAPCGNLGRDPIE